jgi:DNA-directed RNA polymerase
LHEQGSDLAKSLILRADSKPLTDRGFFWLMVQIANNWAGSAGRPDGLKTDKIPMIDRFKWALDNEAMLIDFAIKSKTSTGWMNADNPWQFLAYCIELRKFRMWQLLNGTAIKNGTISPFDYESSMEGYLDGSNNGSQHLAALTRDEETAPHVNLTYSEFPGDLYKYVAGFVWEEINNLCGQLPSDTYKDLVKVIEIVQREKKLISNAPDIGTLKKELSAKFKEFRSEFKEEIKKAAPVFWSMVDQDKDRRKIVKRNIMTIPYGGTPYGLGEQQIGDAKKHGIAHIQDMEHVWGSYMGHMIYNTAKKALKRPMILLDIFVRAGQQAEDEHRFLSWTVPVTNFPVVQYYVEGMVKKTWIQYGPPKGEKKNTGYYENTYQLHVCYIETSIASKDKQSQGAAPNIIHSLDAAHLMMTTCAAPFPITTIHDSYGALLSDMDQLFVEVRKQFVELYRDNPLYSIMKQIGGNIDEVDFGDLDINLILDSEYAFS